jgi:hypothetical protein
MSNPPNQSVHLFQCLITCYSIRQELFDNLTPYSVACLLHIFKTQLGNDVGTAEKRRFLNPMRCLFDKFEMEGIEERIKMGHAIILWGKDLELMTRMLQNPEPGTHKSWPQEISLGITGFILPGSCPERKKRLPGHWQASHLQRGSMTFMKITTPVLGIRLYDMYFVNPRTWTGARSTLQVWTPIFGWEVYKQKMGMARFVHHRLNPKPLCQVDYSIAYINVHESSNVVKRVENPAVEVDHLPVTFAYLKFELEGVDITSPTLEDTLEMRRAWSEGKEAYLQIDR